MPPIRDSVLGALDTGIWRILQDAWEDPSPRNVGRIRQLIETHRGVFFVSPELVWWVRRNKSAINWTVSAWEGKLSP